MQFVIAGAGEVGLGICKTLLRQGHNVVLIEKNEALVKTLNDTLVANIICGDSSFFTTLKPIDWSHCGAFLAMTQSDADNILSCTIAKSLGAKHTICRIHLALQNETSNFNYQAHFSLDHTINTQFCCAFAIAKILRQNHRVLLEQISQSSVELRAIKVGKNSKLIGQKIIDLALSRELRIGLIQRATGYFIPRRDTIIEDKDILTLAGTNQAISDFIKLVNPDQEFTKITLFSGNDISQSLVLLLQNPRFKIKIIDNSLERCQKLSETFPNVSVIHGDATHLPLLQEEQTNDTDYFVACSDDDEKNIIACVQAKKAGAKHTILRVNKEEYEDVCESLAKQLEVDHVISTQNCLWQDLQPVLFPEKISTIDVLSGDNPIEILEIEIPAGAEIEGLSVDHLSLPEQCILLVLKHKFSSKVPAAQDIILGGDCVIAAVRQDHREKLIHILTHKVSLV